MKTEEIIDKWLDKCDEARMGQQRYEDNPSPTNYSTLRQALRARRLMEERLDPRNRLAQSLPA